MTMRSMIAAMAALTILSGTACAQNVVTYHNTLNRSGAFTVPGLTQAAATGTRLDSAFHATLSGNVYAQPLYWKPSGGTVGLLIVATESNLIYALNADTGAQIWKTQLATAAPKSALHCGNIDPEGVTGTPVIDPATGTLYLDALTVNGSGAARQTIYALSAKTGAVLPHWPLDVETAMTARGATFDSTIQGERSALQFFKGKLYVSYAGRFGDCGAYHGIAIEFDLSTPAITGSWETRANGGGIWAQGGLASDGVSLFATTGNTFTSGTWGDGEAVLRLAPGLAHSADTKDYFAPTAWHTLDNNDQDLGGTEALPFLVPTASGTAQRIMALGKDGHAYLLNGSNLGGIGGALANIQVSNTRIITEPAVYRTATGTLVAFTNANGSQANCSGTTLMMLKVTAAATGPISVAWCAPLNGAGAPIVTTTDGTANPIAWVVGAEGDNHLHGFNALTGKSLFSSAVAMDGVRHLSTLIAANRHLYVAADGTVYAFTF